MIKYILLRTSLIKSQSIIPHPEKKLKGGEDAAYSSNRVVAVADGVGGWNL